MERHLHHRQQRRRPRHADGLVPPRVRRAAQGRGDDIVERTIDGLDRASVTAEEVAAGLARLRPDRPVLYSNRRRTVIGTDGQAQLAPRPLSRRRYNSLFDRLQRHLPWADQIGLRSHDLRKTGATFIERAFGHAVARGWLRHRTSNATDGYVLAMEQEVARAAEWLTGKPHPATGSKRSSPQHDAP